MDMLLAGDSNQNTGGQIADHKNILNYTSVLEIYRISALFSILDFLRIFDPESSNESYNNR